MSAGLEPLLRHISVMVEKLPPDTLGQLSQSLAGKRGEALRGNLATLAVTEGSKPLYSELDAFWAKASEITAETLSIAIESARCVCEHVAEGQQISIVWTGPATEAVPLRRTEQVLRQIIDGAQREILIVSFVAYKVDEIVDALRRALDRDVQIRIVLETEQESGGKVSFDQVPEIQKQLPGARVYTWPLGKRYKDQSDHYGAIHAKCAVADRAVALVSSANLTGFALELNMELGLVVKGGGVAEAIYNNFDELIRRSILVQIGPT